MPHERYTRTVQQAERIRQGGHVVVEKWECEWEAQKREDPELRLWAETLDLVTPLDPREAFFGGRTEGHWTNPHDCWRTSRSQSLGVWQVNCV